MDQASLHLMFLWLVKHGYVLMFIAMVIEGPVVTAAAALAAGLGYFNLYLVFLLAVLGDLVADAGYYAIGYWGRTKAVAKWGNKIGLTPNRILRMEALLHQHTIKSILVFKLTPTLAPPGLMLVGALRIRLKRFLTICGLIILPKTILFMCLGYYSSVILRSNNWVISHIELVFGISILMLILISISLNKLTAYIGKRIERL